MSQPHAAVSLEIEIQSLLEELQTPDFAADALIKKYEFKKLNLTQFETLATFLLYCGFYATLTDLILRKLDDGSEIPWGHFAEALFMSSDSIDPLIKEALVDGAEEHNSISLLARSHFLDGFDAEIPKQRQLRRQSFIDRAEKRKQELLHEIEVLGSQGLYQEEDRLVKMYSNLFPEDPMAYEMRTQLRKKRAHEYMDHRKEKPRKKFLIPQFETRSPEEETLLREIESSMHEALQSSSHLAADFALAHLLWDNHEAAIRLIEVAPESVDRDWIHAEALLQGRRFVELLEMLNILEYKYSEDAETVFAVHYLRAQALWGLEQREQAIDILEGMIETRPQYRAAQSLLKEWKEEFQ